MLGAPSSIHQVFNVGRKHCLEYFLGRGSASGVGGNRFESQLHRSSDVTVNLYSNLRREAPYQI